jgi:hypothetical protein
MILMISSLSRAHECAVEIEKASGESVQLCADLCRAMTQLEQQDFSAVIVDELLVDRNLEEAESLFKYFGNAVPVYINFAIAGIRRVACELQFAIDRRKREMAAARREAGAELRQELNDAITALLLSCEMALRVPGLPQPAECKMQSIEALAREMSERLAVPA